jgi:hypothetical protein
MRPGTEVSQQIVVLENRQNPVEYVLIVPPIAFGGIVGMKAPAIGTRTASIKIGTALRSSINQTLP